MVGIRASRYGVGIEIGGVRYTFRTANEWNKWEDEKRRGCLSVAWVLTVAESGVLSQHQHFRGGQRKSRTEGSGEQEKKIGSWKPRGGGFWVEGKGL